MLSRRYWQLLDSNEIYTILAFFEQVAVILSIVVFYSSPIPFEFPFLVAAFATGLSFFMLPAWLLYQTKKPQYAKVLFNMASTYPLAFLLIVVVKLLKR